MTDPNLPPGFCGAIADELERIAADLRKIEHVELPEPRLFHLDIQPRGQVDDEIIAAVDTLGTALLGKTGEHDEVAGGKPWYAVKGKRGPVAVSIYRGLSQHPDDRDAELARLRAEVEQLRADRGLTYSREADDPTPVSGARVEPHVGAVTDAGLVDESEEDDPICPICQSRYSKHHALGLKLHGLAPANEYDESLDMLAPCQPIGCDNGHHVPGCFYAKADS